MRKGTKREGRGAAHGRERARAALLALLAAMFVIFPTYAYGQVFNRTDEGGYVSGTVGGYGYTTYGRQQALAEFLGFDWSSFSTTTQSAIMSAGNNDNAFRSALELTKNVMYETQYDEDAGITAYQWPLVSAWATLFGYDHLWDIKLTRANYESAINVVKKYGFANGGGGGSDSSDSIVVGNVEYEPIVGGLKTDSYVYELQTFDAHNEIKYNFENIASWITSNGLTNAIVFGDNPAGTSHRYVYIGSSDELILVHPVNTAISKDNLYVYNPNSKTVSIKTAYYNSYKSPVDGVVTYPSTHSTTTSSITEKAVLKYTRISTIDVNYYYAGGDDVTPPYIPTPDPEPEPPQQPVAPSPPTFTPYDVVVDPTDGTTTQPIINLIFNDNDYTWGGDNTYTTVTEYDGTEIIEYLKKIQRLLWAIHNDFNIKFTSMNASFARIIDWLREIYYRQKDMTLKMVSAMQTETKWMHDELKTIINNAAKAINTQILNTVGNVDGYIDDAVYSLENYLHNQLTWLAKELKYVSPGQDSNATIVYWLKRIYYQLGGAQEQPLTEDGDVWLAIRDWIHEPYEELIDESPEVSEDVRQKLENLKTKFPFSIPWDILELIEMFKADAVTPSFSIPVPIPNTEQTYTIAGDFHAFDDVMVHVRTVELIAFTGYMLWNTPHLLQLLDITKGKDNG